MKKLIIALFMVSLMSACTREAREDVGLAKAKPNESEIVRQKQLLLPPDFDTIPVSSSIKK